jgi:hypothetical protein
LKGCIDVGWEYHDQIDDDSPANILIGQQHNRDGKQNLANPGNVDQGTARRHEPREHRYHLIGLDEMTDSCKQENGTNADSSGHCGMIEVQERSNQIWSDQQNKDDRYVCHP